MAKPKVKPPHPPNPAALRAKVRRVAQKLEAVYPSPPYDGKRGVLDSLISCILSQNTNDASSGRAWFQLKKRFPTWEAAAAASARRIETAIRSGGLAPSKSKRIKAILTELGATRGEYSLEFIRKMSDDEAFSYMTNINGVGVKTAAVVLLFACGRDVFPVDTHVHRICRRLGLADEGATRDGVFYAMRPLVPGGKAYSFHINLIRFGRERCRKRNPLCECCPLRRQCLYIKGEVVF